MIPVIGYATVTADMLNARPFPNAPHWVLTNKAVPRNFSLWKDTVLRCAKRLPTHYFETADLTRYIPALRRKFPDNSDVYSSVRMYLQKLHRDNYLARVTLIDGIVTETPLPAPGSQKRARQAAAPAPDPIQIDVEQQRQIAIGNQAIQAIAAHRKRLLNDEPIEEIVNDGLCTVCCTNNQDVVVNPCGHDTFCRQCIDRISEPNQTYEYDYQVRNDYGDLVTLTHIGPGNWNSKCPTCRADTESISEKLIVEPDSDLIMPVRPARGAPQAEYDAYHQACEEYGIAKEKRNQKKQKVSE